MVAISVIGVDIAFDRSECIGGVGTEFGLGPNNERDDLVILLNVFRDQFENITRLKRIDKTIQP